MGFGEAVKSFFVRYFDFQTRSSRSEYWWVFLFLVVTLIVLTIPAIVTAESGNESLIFLPVIFYVACIIPLIALSVRRFHDQDKSGWFYLLSLIPYIGGIVLLIFMCLEGTNGPNRFGPDPLNPHFDDVFS